MSGPVCVLGESCAGAPAPQWGGTTRWIDVDGGQIAVETVGSGPALLLLHGWTLDRRMWAMQARALADRFTLVAIDRRGFGQSTAPTDRLKEDDDIDQIVTQLGIAGFALLGMSQAGATAIRYARRNRDRVQALVLQGISLAGVPDRANASDRIPLAEYADLVRTGDIGRMKQHWAAHPLLAGLDGAAADIGAAMLRDYDGRDLLGGVAGPSATLDAVAGLTMPVLAITGAADTPWRRDITAAIGRTAPLGQSRLIGGAGHLCNLSHPAAFNAALSGFLSNPFAPPLHAVNY